MAAKKALPAWKRHELVTKAIFEALLRQDDVKNLEIERDVLIKGTAAEHWVDIFWKFGAGGLI